MLAKRDAYIRLLPTVAFHGSAGSIDARLTSLQG